MNPSKEVIACVRAVAASCHTTRDVAHWLSIPFSSATRRVRNALRLGLLSTTQNASKHHNLSVTDAGRVVAGAQ